MFIQTLRKLDRFYLVRFISNQTGLDVVLNEQIIEYGSNAIDPINLLPFEILDDDFIFAVVGYSDSLNNIKENRDIYVLFTI